MRILAVIPARGGSKGIPKKNIRLMNNKPLIYYAINNAKACGLITDVVVSTDDEEIASIASFYGAEIIDRSHELADDATTLDPVIFDATQRMESRSGTQYDIVITLQVTSPLLTAETLRNAINSFCESEYDTYISVINKPHLSWSRNDSGFFPLYQKRVNRQYLPPNYMETGAFFITRRSFVTRDSRLGKKISVYEIPDCEATDIDDFADWLVCESYLRKKKIVLRCDGYKKLGLGHVYHCLTLAYHLTAHDVMLVTDKNHIEGLKLIENSFLPYKEIESDEDFFDFLKEYQPDIVVNDCLDTSRSYIDRLKGLVPRVVTIEDMGDGIDHADAVINALYHDHVHPNVFSGEKYICLRSEFLINTAKEFSEKVENILVVFGGTDPLNLTKRIYDIAKKTTRKGITFSFIAGMGYDCDEHEIFSDNEKNISVFQDVKNISDYMKNADIAFTSQGRTVYELASLGVPSIVLAQNKREQLHTFAQMNNGFVNLGLGSEVSDETIENTLEWLISTPNMRQQMRKIMLSFDLKNGARREIDIIIGE